ncbi:class I SAM-dependent methyltransferase [Robertmurraya korlensis]|uniref:class I SAM-dependent methyltransferase n=1 Tax=Robertmurraya korlensis TaxID=519977 RepID=UPI0008243881|nr:class I SAM-dependent methyltransferase [Robertmurraya korlensis]
MGTISNQTDQWNANLYDNNHSFVSNYGESLIDMLAPSKGERILDLGCGTGDLAKRLFDQGVQVIGVDKSNNMITQAVEKYPEIPFFVQDATELLFKSEFDAVFSNATLHWVKPPKQALQCIYNSLKTGGRFVAEFGGKGNVQTISDAIYNQLGSDTNKTDFPWYYPSIGEYSSLLEEIGFKVTFAHHYDRPTPLEGPNGLSNWIKMFALSFFNGLDERKLEQVITKIENQLKPSIYNGSKWIADYKRICVIAIKE